MRHLLGTLSEEDRARLEEGYFADDAVFEELEIAEEELIDRYVRGELPKRDRDQFETTIAKSPRLIERVQFARVMANRLSANTAKIAVPLVEKRPPAGERTGWWQRLFGFSAASHAPAMSGALSVLLIIGGAVLVAGYLNLRNQAKEIAAQQAAVEQRQRELDKQAANVKVQTDDLASRGQPSPAIPTPAIVAPQPTPERAAPTIFLTLSAGATRSAGASKSIRLLRGTSYVQLTLNFQGTDYPSHRATIINADRGEVFSKSNVRPQVTRKGAVLTLRVPAEKLSPGDYYVNVYGETPTATESVADYVFRVLR